ncbi:hypothetical protein NQ318_018124 [Aromia moschata]|uniref:Peptidase A2 domain-containing protein n=1 Tax=Aromia moschata TaxID=1265417 RepID=A0AAV8ZFM4_9CUCU|nr:hypothetical protein NQ318_018124 [Aromia moschata]
MLLPARCECVVTSLNQINSNGTFPTLISLYKSVGRSDDKRTVKRQKGERKSGDRRTNGGDRRTNDYDKRTVRRQNDDDKRTVRRQNDDDKRTAKRQKDERKSGDRRTNDDDKTTETRRRGVIRKFKVVEENKEEIERKLEDTRRQAQKEILEKINGLEHQLHRTSIADSGDYSTSPGIPLQNSTLMHTERSVHKILKPPTYDGQSSWSMYRRQFGWTSQEMATSLVISLRGQALEILQSIPEEQQNDYDSIIGALEIRYGHKYLRQVYQSQIKSRQQRSNESLQEYEADIERLIHLAYPQAPKEFLEQIGIQTFIDGLVDTEMQQALRLGRHTTISDALIAALEFKAAKEASRSYKTRVRQVKFDECQSLKETVEKLMKELNEIKQSNSPQKETRRCGKNWAPTALLQGQIKVSVKNELTRSTARFKIKIQESRQKEVPKTSFQITSEKFGKRQLVDARGRVSTTYTQCPKISVSKISSDERSLIVHGYLDDKWCSFVIDTGATRTILRPDILPKSSKELSRHVNLETATGELIPVHGELNVKIQLGSKIMYHRVLTADIRDDYILGLDILSKHGFVVDVKNKTIQIQNEEIVMAPKLQDYNKSRRIIVEEDIQIPQGSENIIIAKLDGNGLSTGIVEAGERNDGL